jgi:hypothetical protein
MLRNAIIYHITQLGWHRTPSIIILLLLPLPQYGATASISCASLFFSSPPLCLRANSSFASLPLKT